MILAVTIVLGFPIIFFLALFPFRVRFAFIRSWTCLVRNLAKWICGIRFKIEGLENIPAGPVLIFSRHESAWETLAFSDWFPMNGFVIKKELLSIPLLGWAFRVSKHIAIDRGRGVKAMMSLIKQGKTRAQEGISLIVFPEGTRMAQGEFRALHKGGAGLAKALELPVVPVVHNAGGCWKRNGFVKYPGCISVKVGKPISPEHIRALSIDQLNEEVLSWFKANYPTEH